MKFESLSLCEPLLRSLQAAGYHEATPIQEKAMPEVLKGRDLVGCAQTGTGKTAAFALPTLQQLMTSGVPRADKPGKKQNSARRPIRALVLAPTRELAGQIGDSFRTYGKFTKLRHTVIYGGVKQGPQVHALQAGVDILVATPGRLLDLVGQRHVKLAEVEILILDEADQMLDMGFIHDLRKIVAQVPNRRQTLMFSATMPKEIRRLASEWLREPLEVKVAPIASTPALVSQSVYFIERNHKAAALTQFLEETGSSKTLVFSRTKRGADRIARYLQRDGIRAISIHGDKSQGKRKSVITEFGSDNPPVLVATDLAARGLDFTDVAHVINYDLPDTPEIYVHRIGRTARAGATGQAVSFCCRDERQQLRSIEKLTGIGVLVEQLPPMSEEQRARADAAEMRQRDAKKAGAAYRKAGPGGRPFPPKHHARSNSRPARAASSRSSFGSRRSNASTSTSRRGNGRPRVAGGR
ncbi:MAG: DEAD/DEAH box helicase [Planctomycetota bacterium]|nr:DEAD/DEAH box helicase [Planctomycetota bacterium]MDA1142276.1 DEAD/DEAH box helicase [Planctomycetota bacterium]